MLGMNHNNNNFDTIAHDEVFYDEIHDYTIDNDNSNDKIAKFNNNNSSNNIIYNDLRSGSINRE